MSIQPGSNTSARVEQTTRKTVVDKRLGLVAVLGAVAIWGPSFVATKVAMAEMRPFLLAFVRFVLATAFLAPLAFLSLRGRQGTAIRLPIGRLASMGLTGGALYFALQNAGLLYVTALEASLVGAILPVVVAIVSWLIAGERLRPVQVAGIALAVAGVVYAVLGNSTARAATFSPLGYLLLLGSAIAWALFTIIGRTMDQEIPTVAVAACSTAFGALFLAPLALFDLVKAGWPTLSPLAWSMIAFLGFGGSGLTFLFWNYGLRALTAGEASTLTNIVPFVGALSAWLFLKEPLTWVHLWGGLTVVLGLALVTRNE